MRDLFLSHMRATKAQVSLCKCVVSPEPSFKCSFAHGRDIYYEVSIGVGTVIFYDMLLTIS